MTAESILKRFHSKKPPDPEPIPRGVKCRVCLVKENDHFPPVQINSPKKAYELVRDELVSADRETLISILLDTGMSLIGVETVAIGSINVCGSTVTEVFKSAILANAPCIVLCHNHPSGALTPSAEDIRFTQNLIQCGKMMGIRIHDHLVISNRGFVSMQEQGLIKP